MTDRKDFIDAIGMPDSSFREAVDDALDAIRLQERRKKSRLMYFALSAAAVLICAVALGALLWRSGGQQPDNVLAQSGRTHMTTPEPTPKELPEPTPEPESGVLPDAKLAEQIFKQYRTEILHLYGGHIYGDIVEGTLLSNGEYVPCLIQQLKDDGTVSSPVCLTSGEPLFASEFNIGGDYHALSIRTKGPGEPADQSFLSYFGELSGYGQGFIDVGYHVNGIIIYLDAQLEPKYVEMYMQKDDDQLYSLWSVNEYHDEYELRNYIMMYDVFGSYDLPEAREGDAEAATVSISGGVDAPTDFEVENSASMSLIGGSDAPTSIYVENSASLGIIGGADGPTAIFVSGNSQIIEDALPNYNYFEAAFSQDLTALWPGELAGVSYATVNSRGSSYEAECWLVKGEDGVCCPAWITWGEIIQGDHWTGEYECPTLNVMMPDDPAHVSDFMDKAPLNLADLYFKCQDNVRELTGDEHAAENRHALSGIKLTFGSDSSLYVCELFFGDTDAIYFRAIFNAEQNTFVIEKPYVDEDGYFDNEFVSPVK